MTTIPTIYAKAICNAFRQFINTDVKWPGGVHDAQVFRNCNIQKGFTSKNLIFFINNSYLEKNVCPRFC